MRNFKDIVSNEKNWVGRGENKIRIDIQGFNKHDP